MYLVFVLPPVSTPPLLFLVRLLLLLLLVARPVPSAALLVQVFLSFFLFFFLSWPDSTQLRQRLRQSALRSPHSAIRTPHIDRAVLAVVLSGTAPLAVAGLGAGRLCTVCDCVSVTAANKRETFGRVQAQQQQQQQQQQQEYLERQRSSELDGGLENDVLSFSFYFSTEPNRTERTEQRKERERREPEVSTGRHLDGKCRERVSKGVTRPKSRPCERAPHLALRLPRRHRVCHCRHVGEPG
jgi:hypothetical protein